MPNNPKLRVPKYEGYRATAAKRLQTPKFEPDEEKPEAEEEDEDDSEDGF